MPNLELYVEGEGLWHCRSACSAGAPDAEHSTEILFHLTSGFPLDKRPQQVRLNVHLHHEAQLEMAHLWNSQLQFNAPKHTWPAQN